MNTKRNDMIFYFPVLQTLMALFILGGCDTAPTKNANSLSDYDWSAPASKILLPDLLHEISGITALGGTSIACVQDEKGVLFVYDFVKKTITEQFPFYADGDYEGIAKVGNSIFVLRSDGTLFKLDHYASPQFTIDSFPTGIPATNNEGLCYRAFDHSLLIACKGKIGKGPEVKDKRAVYVFDLNTMTLNAEPFIYIDLADVNEFADRNGIALPKKKKKKGKDEATAIRLMSSAIAEHPISKKIYLLSAADHALFIFSQAGELEHLELLDEDLFNKSEGIAFLKNGDLMISNEGQDKNPTLLVFGYKQ